MDRLIRMLKLLLLVLLAVMIMGFIKRARVQVNFDDLADAVCAGIDTDTLKQADSRALKRLYGINSEDLAGFVLYTSIESMDVDELLLLEVKSPQLADAAEQSISKRIDSQLANFEGYGRGTDEADPRSHIDRPGKLSAVCDFSGSGDLQQGVYKRTEDTLT